ncbi:hypothetical protein LDENG_00024600 [Lucifuga dentata]|nr:hypothetical protein LDENG_00024600 [Lucifuga dentata]
MAAVSSSNEGNLKENQHITHSNREQMDPTTTIMSELSESCDTLLPQDVLCDSCIDSPSKALKSCLTCLVSYCETHLRPHLENNKFQTHRLVDPLHDIDFILEDVCVIIEQQCARLQKAVEEARKWTVEELEREQRRAFRQAESIQAHMEQRKTKLTKTLGQINRLSRCKTDVNFLQEYSEWKKGVADVCLPTVYNIVMDHLMSYAHVVTNLTQELCELILSSYREKLSMICKNTRNLTFDPDTTHHFLRLTEDNRKLTNTSPWQHSYPGNPARFEYWRQAMTSDSLYLGRHYIEIELHGEGAHIGITYKSIDRKGEQSNSCITGNDFSWGVGRNSRGFSAWHAGVETPLEVTNITKIGLYVDFYQGHIAFFDVIDSMKLLYKYKADFMEPLYCTAWLSKKDSVVALVNAK